MLDRDQTRRRPTGPATVICGLLLSLACCCASLALGSCFLLPRQHRHPQQEAHLQLETVRNERAKAVADWYGSLLFETRGMQARPEVQELCLAATAYAGGLEKVPDQVPVSGPGYEAFWAKAGPVVTMLDQLHYEDLLLADSQTGEVVYSVKRGSELGANLKSGPLAQSLAGQCFQQALQAAPDTAAITGIAVYEPAGGGRAQFTGMQFNLPTSRLYVILLRVPLARLDEIAADLVKAGPTADCLLLDSTGLVLNNTRLAAQSGQETALKVKCSTRAAQDAISGGKGVLRAPLDDGTDAYQAFAPLEPAPGLKWAIIVSLHATDVKQKP